MNKSCFFIGDKKIKHYDGIFYRLNYILISLIDEGVTNFYAGGGLGWDMICENTVIKLRREFTHIKLRLILPCEPCEQSKHWHIDRQLEYNRVYDLADSVEVISQKYSEYSVKKRNARLAELGDVCVCYWDGRTKGYTYQAIKLARKNSAEIINFYGR